MKKKIICSVVFVLVMQHFAFAKAKEKEKFLTRGQFVQMIYDWMSALPNFKDVEVGGVVWSDIPESHKNYKAAKWLVQSDIIGCSGPGGLLKPEVVPTREEIIVIFKRVVYMIGKKYQIKFPYSAATLMKFSDLPDDKEVCDAVLKVADVGIIEGYPSETKKTGDLYNDPEMKNPVPLAEAKKYFVIIKSTTEKLFKEKGITLKDPAK